MMFLFGIIQYGYGLFQYQAFTSAMNDASRLAAGGIQSCDWLDNTLDGMVEGNGLNQNDLSDIKVSWLQTNSVGQLVAADAPVRLGGLQLTATYQPIDLGIPFIPFPKEFRGKQQVTLQNVLPVELGPACQVLNP